MSEVGGFLALALVAGITVVGHIYIALKLNRIEHNVNGLIAQGRADSKAAGKAEEKAEEAERDEAANPE